jgi:cell division protein FtsQ
MKSCLVGLTALLLLVGAWLGLRNSPLVKVNRVQISGVHGTDAAAIESALTTAARRMSTMDVHAGALLTAVAPYRVVREVQASTIFPHGLRLRVVEQPAVAAVTTGTARTAVAADGVVLGPGFLSSSLPVIHAAAPAEGAQRVTSAPLLAELTILGSAPETMIGWVSRVFMGRNGITVAMRNGLLLYFGDATRPHAKWLSAARVLADPSAAGASYLDVRLPERPAAGMGTSGTSSGATSTAGQVSASDPTAAALAATLESAVSGGAGSTPAGVPSSGSATSEASTGSAQSTPAGTSTGAATATSPAGSGTSTSSLAGSASTGAASSGSEAAVGASSSPTPGG